MNNPRDGELERSPFKPGALVNGRYKILRVLGSGGTGYVILAEDTEFGSTLVVLKLLYPHLVQDERAYHRFRNETAIAFELSHPNIAQTYSFEQWPGIGCFITMEHLPNGSLHDVLSKLPEGRLDFDLLLLYLNQVVNALQYAHSRGVVHRDIKPHNLLLNSLEQVKVGDFGLSQMRWGDVTVTCAGDVIGTPHYMSPEQLEGLAIDHRSDLYSLGITAFELTAGRRPFEAPTLFELASLHLHEPLPSLPHLGCPAPPWFQQFLERCSAKRPEDRFFSAEEAADFLKGQMPGKWQDIRIEEHATSRAAEASVSELQKQLRRKIWRWSIAGSAVLLLSLFIVLPNAHTPVNRRYARMVLAAERAVGAELTLMRKLFGVTVRWSDRDKFFMDYVDRTHIYPLLEAGMDPNFYMNSSKGYMTPLGFWTHDINHHTFRTVRKLVAHGADVNAQDENGITPLMNCIRATWRDCIPLLLEHGAKPNLQNKLGRTALHFAVRYQASDIAAMLLKAGADPLLEDTQGNSPLSSAERRKHTSSEAQKTFELLAASAVAKQGGMR